jgi:hypothetical protein
MCKEAVMIYFMVLSRNLSGCSEDDHEIPNRYIGVAADFRAQHLLRARPRR